jgi:hypothetical protein
MPIHEEPTMHKVGSSLQRRVLGFLFDIEDGDWDSGDSKAA